MKQNTRQVLASAARLALAPVGFNSPMGLEPLEDRRMMTATPAAPITLSSAGVLSLRGNAVVGNQLRVEFSSGGTAQLQADVNGTSQSFAAASVKQIRITGGAGDDNVYVDPALTTPASIVTGRGNDSIVGGDGHDVIRAGAGNDTVYTTGGTNVIYEGTGSKTIVSSTGDRVVDARGHEVRPGGLANSHLYQATATTGTTAATPTATTTTVTTTETARAATAAESATTATTGGTATAASDPVAAPTSVVAGTATATATTEQLTGKTYGTSGSWDNIAADTTAAATDGNLNTFFDAPTAGGNVGIDLGSAQTVTQIKFAPRAGYASRMVGGVFQYSASPTFSAGITTVYTITSAPADGVLTVVNVAAPAERYWRYMGPNEGYGNIAEFQLFGPAPATAASGATGNATAAPVTAAPTTTATPTTTTTAAGAVQPAVYVAGGTPSADLAALSVPMTPGGTTANGKPVAVLDVMPGIRQTGLVLNVDGLNSAVGVGTCITTQYQWNFGDPTGAHNELTGYNAGHVYDTPGTYTVTLTVTNANGQTSTAQGQVTIAPAARTLIYVDSKAGNDANAGTASAPLASAAAAFAKVGNNTEVLFKAGETFDMAASVQLNSTNVVIGRYGTGANPVLMQTTAHGDSLTTWTAADGMTVQDVTFDSIWPAAATGAAPKLGVGGIYLRGSNITVRDCEFLNVDDAISLAGNPGGTLVEDNTAPLVNGLRGYMVWVQGARGTIVGNTCANSTREHCIRLCTATEATVEDNTLANLDRTAEGDSSDNSKGCIEMQQGSYAWIQGNTVTDGDIRVGPRGADTGGETTTSSTAWCVIQDNQLTDTFVAADPGSDDIMIQNNVVLANTIADSAFQVAAPDADGRVSTNITIRNNTVVQAGVSGNFLKVGGWVNGISLTNNLYIAPQLQVANNGACAVYVNGSDLSCFSKIADNVWPTDTVPTGKWGSGGVNYVGTQYTSSEFVTPATWLGYSQVSGDALEDVNTSDLKAGTYQLPASASDTGLAAGATLALAA